MNRLRPALISAAALAFVVFGIMNLRREVHMHDLVAASAAYLDSIQDFNKRTYQFGQYAHYDYDQRRGTLIFSDSNWTPRLVARIQVVGDVSQRSRTWLWAWANPTVEAPLKDAAQFVRDYGERHDLARLRDSLWSGDETDGWEMTAITAKLTHAKGAYRSPSDSGPLFMVLTDIRWAIPTDSTGRRPIPSPQLQSPRDPLSR